jgi:hypothetical protein
MTRTLLNATTILAIKGISDIFTIRKFLSGAK